MNLLPLVLSLFIMCSSLSAYANINNDINTIDESTTQIATTTLKNDSFDETKTSDIILIDPFANSQPKFKLNE